MSAATDPEPRTAAALAARRRTTEAAVRCVHDAITRLRREKARISVVAVARRADVSRTFIYDNPEAITAVSAATAQTGERRDLIRADQDGQHEAAWRERTLNAENALKAAHAEILAQRTRIGELLGRSATFKHVDRGSHPADHHREHHTQATGPPTHRRQPHPR